MVLFVGPPGSGKSVQGQIMSARHDWRWLGVGQLLRDAHNDVMVGQMKTGEMVDNKLVNRVVAEAIARARDVTHVILDGYPRQLEQAEWLVKELPKHERNIAVVIVFKVSEVEIMRRLKVRGRPDDQPEIISKRMADYHNQTEPILDYYRSLEIPVAEIDGEGSVGQVHDRIQAEIEKWLPA